MIIRPFYRKRRLLDPGSQAEEPFVRDPHFTVLSGLFACPVVANLAHRGPSLVPQGGGSAWKKQLKQVKTRGTYLPVHCHGRLSWVIWVLYQTVETSAPGQGTSHKGAFCQGWTGSSSCFDHRALRVNNNDVSRCLPF